MKNYSIKFTVLRLLFGGLFLLSCENETVTNEQPVIEQQFSKQEQINLAKVGFEHDKTRLLNLTNIDGTKSKYYAFDDMLVLESNLKNIDSILKKSTADTPNNDTRGAKKLNSRGFYTDFNVNGNRIYKVAFVDFVDQRHIQACQDLIFKFNEELKTTIKLDPIFVSPSQISTTERDITVWWQDIVTTTPEGFEDRRAFFAFADFPGGNGLPGKNVRVNVNFSQDYSRAFLRTILLHEFGHIFGLRHSDWQTRSSCTNSTGGETNLDGANPIPNTNISGDFIYSIMRACFFEGEELGYFDEDFNAMRWLFGFQP